MNEREYDYTDNILDLFINFIFILDKILQPSIFNVLYLVHKWH